MLGINLGHHDSSICYLEATANTWSNIEIFLSERIGRKKNAGGFPVASLRYFKKTFPQKWDTLSESDIALNCFGNHPKITEKKTAETNLDYLTFIEGFGLEKASTLYNPKLHFIPHHLAHAYSIWPVCPFEKALIVVSDGAGSAREAFSEKDEEWELVKGIKEGTEYFSVYAFENGKITSLEKEFFQAEFISDRKIRFGVGLGSNFEFTSHLIFNNWNQAGKVMGLSACGKAQETNDILEYLSGLNEKDFEIFKTKEEFDSQSEISFQRSADVAATVQAYFEKVMLTRLEKLHKKYPGFENLVLVGGCALNGLLNMKIVNQRLYKHVYVPPFPNDEGIALGCAIKLAFDRGEIRFKSTPIQQIHPYLGSSANDVALHTHRIKDVFSNYKVEETKDIVAVTAELLKNNEIVAWMQGRSEVGPRALGHRSILARPDIPDLKSYLNHNIKYREKFRPYGGTVLKELASTYFEVDENFHSPFMTFCAPVRSEYRKPLAGITHVDGTCRPQTLCEEQNPLYYKLIKECHKQFGLGVILNTSLNTMGQPIVETLEDAKVFFEESQIKYLVIGNFLIRK